MAYTLSIDYKEEEIVLARFAKAMGHPARIAILNYLATLDTCCFGDINKELPISKATVSQHLSELKDAGLIRGSIVPPKVNYCIDKSNWEKAKKMLQCFFDPECCKIEVQKTTSKAEGKGKVKFYSNLKLKPNIDEETKSTYQVVKGEKVMLTHFEVPPDTVFAEHSHESEQITYVLAGELIFELDNKEFHVKKGDAIIIPSNVVHKVRTNEACAIAVDAWSPVNEKY